jgi:hypothetical protein
MKNDNAGIYMFISMALLVIGIVCGYNLSIGLHGNDNTAVQPPIYAVGVCIDSLLIFNGNRGDIVAFSGKGCVVNDSLFVIETNNWAYKGKHKGYKTPCAFFDIESIVIYAKLSEGWEK